jgi:hypothetical protein
MLRTIRIWTWDAGHREIDPDDEPRRLVPVLETILEGGLWGELRKFPRDAVARLLPYLHVPAHTRRFLEIWVEATPRGA